MAKRVNPTLVGAFVLGAFLLVIAALLLLGGENIFAQKRRFVIYFGDAITILDHPRDRIAGRQRPRIERAAAIG